MGLGIKNVIRTNHMISLITSSTADPSMLTNLLWFLFCQYQVLKWYLKCLCYF